ncbi:helix-turn-helix domain-containing protein [Nesterenkonia massiliensis]|uniref:Helix-turn-helix domain-containing protein n=1 Tax=Nesterenkonia massiliensis TaxID=1232429 RepID=A0ABT2HQ01_9MICC|nr:helix-turn-helix domain-containing protein [Nesterenkonia massiliensis]MCT1606772.1 helix-turn-helix domain-containing protein [Nesterenkonia massiliensis]
MEYDERLRALEHRVAMLEEIQHATPHVGAGEEPTPPPEDDTFWALDGLRSRMTEPGAVMVVGSVRTPKGVEARWQTGASVDDLFDSEFAERAEAFSALGHPMRLRMLQRLMTDAHSVADLVSTGEFGTTGQIYHHLRQLTSAGWLRATGGGRYEVPVARIVPLLTVLLAVD